MAHPLDGSRARIERAGDHLESLDTLLTRFVKDGGFVLAGKEDTDTGEHVLRIYSNRNPPVPPPLTASVMVGDALNSLRSALDYVIWALARLNDVDKHRLLLAAATSSSPRRGRFQVSGLDAITIRGREWVPFEQGAELYRMKLTPHEGGKVEVKAEVPYTIVFSDPDSGLAVSVADLRMTLISISNIVESFAADFPPAHETPPVGRKDPPNGGSPSPPPPSDSEG